MRPRRLADASVRPLNFTVRRHDVPSQAPQGIPPQVLLLLGLGLAAFLYARLSKQLRYKRVAWTMALILFAVGFLYIPVQLPKFGWRYVAMMSPLFLMLYFQFTFCQGCGAMIRRGPFWRRPQFCPACGARQGRDA